MSLIIADTNVVSALMRIEREPLVAAWLNQQTIEHLFISTPTIFELRYGVSRLRRGRRRARMEMNLEDVIATVFADRILVFDVAAARAAGDARAIQMAKGINCDVPDTQIAGVAIVHQAAVATRDTTGFSGHGLTIINPWHSE